MNDRKGQKWNLAMETTGRVGSVAIGRGDDVLDAVVFSGTQRHAVELLPAIARLCEKAGITPRQIEHVYVSGGPGSFTGIRIGITVARTLTWSIGARAVALPTLDVVAQNGLLTDTPPAHLGVVLDAKRSNVFAASFELRSDRYERRDEPAERDPCAFFESLPDGAAVIGEGCASVAEVAERAGLNILAAALHRPRAETVHALGRAMARAGRFTDLHDLIPEYVRRPEAEEVWDRRHGPVG